MAPVDDVVFAKAADSLGVSGEMSAPMLLLLIGRAFSAYFHAGSSKGRSNQQRQLGEILSVFRNPAALMGSSPDQLYNMLWAADKEFGCGLKLTCTLASLPKHKAVPQDMLLLRMFGRRPFTVTSDELNTAVGIYKYAAFMGAKSMNLQTCDDLFKACEMDAEQMVPVWRGVVELLPTMVESLGPMGR